MPVSSQYQPAPLYQALGPDFADAVAPARFPKHILRRRNQAWAARVGLDGLTNAEWENHFAAFVPLPGNMSQPLAMRYHGHQFRHYNHDIGDGRGFLFAQVRDAAGRLLDLAAKGSGQTPYSRRGDGRLTLKGGVREVLAADMLEALGVVTSKALSLFETGEALARGDEPSPTRSSVLVRLQHSHIRFGTFQRLAFIQRPDLMEKLIAHCAEAYFPDLLALDGPARAAGLLAHAARENARLAASWMAAGFVHGVLNTDNLTITGESFDYGPWRFLPSSDPNFTAAYFDETGLYSFGRQPEAVSWALMQLAGALTLACPTERLEAALAGFAPAYQRALIEHVCARLAIKPLDTASDLEFLGTMFGWMTETQAGWAQFFHDWVCANSQRAEASPQAALYATPAFAPVRAGLEARAGGAAALLAHPAYQRAGPIDLLIDDVEAIWAPIAEADDWSAFEAKLADIETLKTARRLHQPVASGG